MREDVRDDFDYRNHMLEVGGQVFQQCPDSNIYAIVAAIEANNATVNVALYNGLVVA